LYLAVGWTGSTTAAYPSISICSKQPALISQETYPMPLECVNPSDLPVPEIYSQVVVATGSKLVFVSGQQPEDIYGKLVGHGDFAAQVRLAFGNLGRALAAAGARPEYVCKITIYIVDYKRDEHVPIIEQAQIDLFGDHKPANVVVGIAVMSPGYLIEVDAIAVIG
jgi:enamine deaminase RidA (YjgF/YER057c/UK114 family)